MARGTANGEPVVSQASTDAFRDGYARAFGDRPPQRGRWIWDAAAGRLVDASSYVRPVEAKNAPIIADRIHEGTVFHDGERLRDLGSRRKRREFLRQTGLAEAGDYSPGYREAQRKATDRHYDHRIESSAEEAVRKLHHQRKWRE